MAEVYETMALRIRELRQCRKITLQELADRSGLSRSYIWELEKGRRRKPTIETGIALSRALGCSFVHLTGVTYD